MKIVKLVTTLSISLFLTTNIYGQNSKKTCQNFNGFVVAALVDVSEPLSQPQQLVYERLVRKILAETPGNARFDLYRIAPNTSGIEPPIISVCKPWPKFDNSFVKGDKFWEKKLEKEFFGPAFIEMDESPLVL